MKSVFFILMVAFIASAAPVQRCGAQSRNEFGEAWGNDDSTVTVNRPSDLFEPWKLTLRSGRTILCNRTDIALEGDDLGIRGTMKRVAVTRAEVKSILMQQPRLQFRDGFIAGLYLGSALLLSPSDMPGGYTATKQKGFGLNLTSLLVVGLAGACGGAIAGMTEPEISRITLDGSEETDGWRLLLKGRETKWHFRGVAAWVSERGGDQWKQYYERAGGRKTIYSYSTIEDDAIPVNFLRSVSGTYSLSDRLEIGAAFTTGGVPIFYRDIPYYSSGSPPVTSTVTLSGYYRANGYYAALCYLPVPVRPGAFSVRLCGMAGLGVVGFNPNENYYYSSGNSAQQQGTLTRLSGMVGASVDYNFDARLSIGLAADYSFFGKRTLPAEDVTDYSGVVRARLPGTEIDLNSYSIGLVVGVSY